MAVNNIDVGAIIAEAIDRCFTRQSSENWLESYQIEARVLIEQWRSAVLSESYPDPDRRSDATYRRGYKTGWRAAHENRPATPGSEGGNYADGYAAGYQASQHGQKLLSLYNKEHVKEATKHNLNNVIGPYMGGLYARKVGGGRAQQDWEDKLSDWVMGGKDHPENENYKFSAPLSLHHAADAVQHINNSLDTPDDKHDVVTAPHPADIGQVLTNRIKKAASFGQVQAQQKERKIKAGAEARGEMAAADKGIQEQMPLPDYKEQLERQLYDSNTIAAHNAGRVVHEGIKEFRDAPHKTHDEARKLLHDLWVREILKKVNAAKDDIKNEHFLKPVSWAETKPHPEDPSIHIIPNQDDKSVKFDPIQYIQDRFSAPNGWAGPDSSTWAVRQQLGNSFTHARVPKEDAARLNIGVTKHPHSGRVNGITKRIDTWLLENVPEFTNEKMWEHHYGIHGLAARGGRTRRKGKEAPLSPEEKAKLADVRKGQRGKRVHIQRDLPPEAVEQIIHLVSGVIQTWLSEHVEIPANRMNAVMEDIRGKLVTSFDLLVEEDDLIDDGD